MYSLLGYTQCRNFETIINKAKAACTNAGEDVAYHFADVSKMVSVGSGAEREIDDIYFTRYACYLIAQNGDARKPAIAFAQNYYDGKPRNLSGTIVSRRRFKESGTPFEIRRKENN